METIPSPSLLAIAIKAVRAGRLTPPEAERQLVDLVYRRVGNTRTRGEISADLQERDGYGLSPAEMLERAALSPSQ